MMMIVYDREGLVCRTDCFSLFLTIGMGFFISRLLYGFVSTGGTFINCLNKLVRYIYKL